MKSTHIIEIKHFSTENLFFFISIPSFFQKIFRIRIMYFYYTTYLQRFQTFLIFLNNLLYYFRKIILITHRTEQLRLLRPFFRYRLQLYRFFRRNVQLFQSLLLYYAEYLCQDVPCFFQTAVLSLNRRTETYLFPHP